MKQIRTLMLAKTGVWGTQSAELTKQDFAEIIETFNVAPVYFGHDASHKDSEPSYGKVIDVSLSDDGNTLYGDVVLMPEADKMFSEKRYDSWSVGVPRRRSDGKRVLNHLALLGSTKPAIPGLRQIAVRQEFSEDEIKDSEITFDGKMSEFREESSMTEEEKKKMADLEAENKKLKEEQKASEDKKKSDDEKSKQNYADMAARCEALEKGIRDEKVKALTDKFSDKVPAGVMPKIKAVAEALSVAGECEFSDGSETKKQAALDAFADVLGGIFTVTANKEILDDQFDAGEYSDKAKKGGESEKGNPADIAARM